MTVALRLDGIVQRFGATLALDGASLEVRPGEVHALLGENGAGKSTLLGVVGGLLAPEAGTMEVGGEPYAPRSPRDARERGIALIHQELSLFPHLTVAENVLMGSEPSRRGCGTARRPGAEPARCSRVRPPRDRPRRPVSRLPIGARQVVEICRAMAARARVLLMDEPTSSLPRGDVERLFADDRPALRGRRRRRLHQPLPRGDARGRVRVHRPAGRAHGGERGPSRGHERRAHRPDGGPHRGELFPPARARRPARSPSRWTASPPPGCARPPSPCAAARCSASSA
jgi:ABC-type branched-subunit amino acid transport system ATPase component